MKRLCGHPFHKWPSAILLAVLLTSCVTPYLPSEKMDLNVEGTFQVYEKGTRDSFEQFDPIYFWPPAALWYVLTKESERLKNHHEDMEANFLKDRERAIISYVLEDYTGALNYIRSCKTVKMDDAIWESSTLAIESLVHIALGNYPLARRSISIAEEKFATTKQGKDDKERYFETSYWIKLAKSKYFMERFISSRALKNLEALKGLIENRHLNPSQRALFFIVSGDFYNIFGDRKKALQYYRTARTISVEKKIIPMEIVLFRKMANSHMDEKEYKEAQNHLQKAKKLLEAQDTYGLRYLAASIYMALAKLYALENNTDMALKFFELSTRYTRKYHNTFRYYLYRGRFDKEFLDRSIYISKKAAEMYELKGDDTNLMIAYYNLGLAYHQKNDLGSAIHSLELSIDYLEKARANIGYSQYRKAFVESRFDVFLRIVKLLVKQDRHEEAFYYSEKVKSRNLFENLIQKDLSSFFTKKNKALLTKVDKTEEALAYKKSEYSTGTVKDIEVEKENIRILEKKYRSLEIKRRLTLKKKPLYSAVVGNPLKYDDIRSILKIDKKVNVVSYFILDDSVLIWVFRPDKVFFKRVGIKSNELTRLVSNFLKRVSAPRAGDYLSSSIRLHSLLISPIEHFLGKNAVVCFVLNGVLHTLPYESLFDGKRFFIEKYLSYYVPSMGVYELSMLKRKKEKTLNIISFGDATKSLPFVRFELDSIKKAIPWASIVEDDSAYETTLKEHGPKYNILHFAGHGRFDFLNPNGSYLIMKEDKKNDGFLTVREIYDLHSDYDLVVLSACQTGLNKISKSDELLGMSRAFLFAGTHSLIASLWEIEDKSTAMLMENFYNHIKKYTFSEALRKAKMSNLRKFHHPYYWSAFIPIGDYKLKASGGERIIGDFLKTQVGVPEELKKVQKATVLVKLYVPENIFSASSMAILVDGVVEDKTNYLHTPVFLVTRAKVPVGKHRVEIEIQGIISKFAKKDKTVSMKFDLGLHTVKKGYETILSKKIQKDKGYTIEVYD